MNSLMTINFEVKVNAAIHKILIGLFHPDGDTIIFEELSSLSLNKVYKVFTHSHQVILKILSKERPLDERYNEVMAMMQSSEIHLSPHVIYPTKSDIKNFDFSFVITKYINSMTLSPNLIANKSFLKHIANSLRKLHNSKFSLLQSGTPFEITRYFLKLAGDKGYNNHETIEKINLGLEMLEHCFEGYLAPFTSCHFDVHYKNILFSLENNNQCFLIDWEGAINSDPYFDLSSLAFYHNFSEAQVEQWLALYHQRPARPEEIRMIYFYRRLCLLMMASWMCFKTLDLNVSQISIKDKVSLPKLSSIITNYISGNYTVNDINYHEINILNAALDELFD